MDLIDSLIGSGWLKTPRIINAFKKIKRADFLPKGMENLAELNEALPIGYGQTISQPLVVAFMMELLEPREGEKILDIGSGSGWTTALLAEIIGPKGKVIAIEVIPELKEFGEKNVAKYNFLAPHRTEGSGAGIEKQIVECICADGSKGYPKIASRPEFAQGFDKILVSARAERCFPAWKEQLKVNGRIVTPIGSSIWLFIKNPSAGGKTEFTETEYPDFVFVPLVESR